jgi:hypothetical protein
MATVYVVLRLEDANLEEWKPGAQEPEVDLDGNPAVVVDALLEYPDRSEAGR